jgi:hypothetical protein
VARFPVPLPSPADQSASVESMAVLSASDTNPNLGPPAPG